MAEGPQEPRQGPPRPEPPRSSNSLLQAGGAVAEGIVGGLKSQPVMLLVLVLNIGFLTLVHFGVQATGERHHQEMSQLITSCFGGKEGPR